MKQFAKILTFIIHPATLAIPAVFLIVYKEIGTVSAAISWTLISMIFTGIVGGFVVYGVKKGFFSDVDISVRRQRVILYPFVIGVILLLILCVYLLQGPTVLIFAGIFLILSLIVFDLINIKIKASVHVASIASLSVVLVALYGGWAYWTLFLIPFIAWARIIQKRHTLKETIVGAMSGILLTVAALFVIQYIV